MDFDKPFPVLDVELIKLAIDCLGQFSPGNQLGEPILNIKLCPGCNERIVVETFSVAPIVIPFDRRYLEEFSIRAFHWCRGSEPSPALAVFMMNLVHQWLRDPVGKPPYYDLVRQALEAMLEPQVAIWSPPTDPVLAEMCKRYPNLGTDGAEELAS